MTDVLVCVKRVPDTSGEVVLTADGGGVDGRYAGWTMSAHEECAVELGVQVAGETGGSVTVLTLGDEDSVEQLRAALAVGAHEAVRIDAVADDYGPADVATAIADVVRAREADGSGFGLVLVGNDAADTGDHQVGIRLAHLLDRPVVAGAQEVTLAGERLEVRSSVSGPTEVYDVPLPAVLTVWEGGVEPRYPNISGRMKAKKAQVEVVQPGSAPQGSGRLGLRVLPPPESNVEVLGEGAAAAPRLVAVLREIGVVR
ncbi:electron transfer flavoprotein subunit alpha [Serinicoccus sp. CNJ-927]|uniref:electron transfer flavoprotein subunit beta/FixA family protein n=1 Tax=unclassified Serinicoccus TaxID=2643101 RepID=UPI0009654352|nr:MULTISPECIES: electron transfer flavoprotein subunit alpha [unclassified Serinicoccus]OLT16638.1 electron transfer flavoprotein subunit alpha [Serinicoccus sp. CUA-874]OLT41845.1 electron transfer flavoprotein subunit alpha [Serinicoccus sp. CNJ-927]